MRFSNQVLNFGSLIRQAIICQTFFCAAREAIFELASFQAPLLAKLHGILQHQHEHPTRYGLHTLNLIDAFHKGPTNIYRPIRTRHHGASCYFTP